MSKIRRLEAHLNKGKTVSGDQAFHWWNIPHLRTLISDLRKEGMKIKTIIRPGKSTQYKKSK